MSLLKTNEIQNYNGSSLTLTASTVSTSAQLNTGGNISVTGSLNVSDDSTTRTNLGLGTIATQDSDSITVTGGTATLGALTVSGSDSGNLVRITQTGSGNALVVEDSANPDSTPFVVDASGNVGIGTSSPSARLDVNGAIKVQSSAAPTFDTNTRFWTEAGVGARYDSFQHRFDVGLSRTEALRIDSSGNVKIFNLGTGTVYSNSGVLTNTNPSDLNLKENVVEVSYGLSEVKQLRPVEFDWIADEADRHELGFIAQEVQLIIPDLVNTYERIINEETDETEIGYGLESTQFIPVLVKAIQEQQTMIESQQSQIDALTAKTQEQDLTIASLISRIEALETPAE